MQECNKGKMIFILSYHSYAWLVHLLSHLFGMVYYSGEGCLLGVLLQLVLLQNSLLILLVKQAMKFALLYAMNAIPVNHTHTLQMLLKSEYKWLM